MAVSLPYEDGARSGRDPRRRPRGRRHHAQPEDVEIPLKLARQDPPAVLEVRGEVYMTNSDLARLNEEQKRGERRVCQHAEPTAGTLRLLDPRICAQRRLRFLCHGLAIRGHQADSHMEFLEELSRCGLPPTPRFVLRIVRRGDRPR